MIGGHRARLGYQEYRAGRKKRSSPIANNVDVKRCCAEICEARRTSHMRRDTQRQVAGSFRRPRSAAAAWPQLRRRRSSVIRARYARAAFAEAASGGTRLGRARLPVHRGARPVATDVKPDDPGMACRPGREPRRMQWRVEAACASRFRMCPGAWPPRRRSSFRREHGRCLVSGNSPRQTSRSRVLCDNTQRSAACPPSSLCAPDNRANSPDEGRHSRSGAVQ